MTTCGSNILIPFLVTSTFNVDESSVSRRVEGRVFSPPSSPTKLLFNYHCTVCIA
jgi:hypothetical protein